jgi:membrane protease YdiL (CAAX protease family)
MSEHNTDKPRQYIAVVAALAVVCIDAFLPMCFPWLQPWPRPRFSLLVTLPAFIALRRLLGPPFQLQIGLPTAHTWRWLAAALVLPVALVALSEFLFRAYRFAVRLEPSPPYPPMSWATFSTLWLPMSGVAAPIKEELAWRGILAPALALRFGTTGSIVVCGVLFATVHAAWGVLGVDTFIGGFVITWLALRSRSLLIAVFTHELWNLIVGLLRVHSSH